MGLVPARCLSLSAGQISGQISAGENLSSQHSLKAQLNEQKLAREEETVSLEGSALQ